MYKFRVPDCTSAKGLLRWSIIGRFLKNRPILGQCKGVLPGYQAGTDRAEHYQSCLDCFLRLATCSQPVSAAANTPLAGEDLSVHLGQKNNRIPLTALSRLRGIPIKTSAGPNGQTERTLKF